MKGNVEYIKEKGNAYSKSITFEQMKMFFEQMPKCICKIKCNNGSNGTGFFCTIPYLDDWSILRVLITNNHVLGENDILPKKNINISLNNEKVQINILIDKSRIT
jgi:hypothetical protein